MLTKEELLKVRLLSYEDVDCPTLGGVVRVRGMTTGDADIFQQRCAKLDRNDVEEDVMSSVRSFNMIHHIVDMDDNLMFTSADIPLINKWDTKDSTLICEAIARLRGEELIEDTKKN